jgi:DNA-binding CsgD family transcriptional regulator
MAKSERLRLRDVRAAFRLIGECVELGGDPTMWRTRLYEGLCKLTGAVAAIGGESDGFFGQESFRLLHMVRTGLSAADWRTHDRFMAIKGYESLDTATQRFCEKLHPQMTGSHEQLYARQEWLQSALFNEFFRATGFDDRLLSFVAAPGESGRQKSAWNGITLYRMVGDPLFTARERRLVHLVHREVQPLLGTRLATCSDRAIRPLSPRLRQVLDLVLLGQSEKEIAQQCGLAKSTVHEYATALYRRYGVRGRVELMALFLRWRSHSGESDGSSGTDPL